LRNFSSMAHVALMLVLLGAGLADTAFADEV
jgi:hypothetical protein